MKFHEYLALLKTQEPEMMEIPLVHSKYQAFSRKFQPLFKYSPVTAWQQFVRCNSFTEFLMRGVKPHYSTMGFCSATDEPLRINYIRYDGILYTVASVKNWQKSSRVDRLCLTDVEYRGE